MNTFRLIGLFAVVLVSAWLTGCSESASSRNKSNKSSRPPQANDRTERSEDLGQCDPNYSGCVPIASDVDCLGGPGNGPAYVKGPVRVIGKVLIATVMV